MTTGIWTQTLSPASTIISQLGLITVNNILVVAEVGGWCNYWRFNAAYAEWTDLLWAVCVCDE